MAKVSTKPAPMTTVVYRGEREDLNGKRFKIPSNVANKAKYIEQEYDKQQAEAEAKAERERIQAEEQEAERVRAAEAELEIEAQDDIPEPTNSPAPVAITDGTDQLALAASLSNVTGSLLTQSREVEQLQAQVVDLKATVEGLLDQLAVAGIEKSEALKLVKSNQTMMNALIQDTSLQINGMQSALNDAEARAQALRVVLDEYGETVEKAAKINESAIAQATNAANETIDERYDEFLAFLSFALKAMGLSPADLNQQMNAGRMGGAEQFLTREYLATAASIMRSFDNAPEPLADVKAADQAVDPNFPTQMGR
jgi:hypothetical protein